MTWQLVGNIAGRHGRDGRDADLTIVKGYVDAAVQALPPPPKGRDGSSVTADDLHRSSRNS